MNSPHKGQWRGASMFSLICAWINGWVKQSWFETPSHPIWHHCNDPHRDNLLFLITVAVASRRRRRRHQWFVVIISREIDTKCSTVEVNVAGLNLTYRCIGVIGVCIFLHLYEIWIKVNNYRFTNMHLNISHAKLQPFLDPSMINRLSIVLCIDVPFILIIIVVHKILFMPYHNNHNALVCAFMVSW